MTDYSWWIKALDIGKGRELTRDQQIALGVSEDAPQAGFFRKRAHKDGPYVPVAIWSMEGGMVALVGDQPQDPGEIWTFCSRWPISEDVYRAVTAGGAWPDEPPAPVATNARPVSDDPFDQLNHEFASEKEQAEAFLKKPITTQEQADMAAVWSKRLATIAKKATDLHKVAKQPHLDAGRAVDDRWRDLKEAPDVLSKRLKRHLDAFLQEQDRIERERQRLAQIEADRIRREAEEAARKVAEAERLQREAETRAAAAPDEGVATLFGKEAEREADRMDAEREAARANAERLARQAADAEREAEARNANAGRTGAKVALRTFVSARIVDYDAALMALKDRPEIRELVETLANRAVKAGVDLPGVEKVEERRAA